MNIRQIEQSIQGLIQNLSRDTFIYDLLSAYGLPKASITRLQHGTYNLSKTEGEILWKKKLYFRSLFDEDLHGFIDTRRKDEAILKHAPRFLVVTDFDTLLAYDCKTEDTLDIPLSDLPRHHDFFLPWAGMEKAQSKLENPADVKAAVKMAQLYDLIRHDNPDRYADPLSLHELNVFLSRLLFCYFAEDTEIFPHKLFTNSIASHTQSDASDLDTYLNRLFDVLNTPESTTPSLNNLGTIFEPLNSDARAAFPEYLQKFPYVNGGLFAQTLCCPKFSARTRKLLIECGRDLNWSNINPDIFGSMMQAVAHPDQRGGMGMHYTSITNIMKVIEPLFLDDLYQDFDEQSGDERKLKRLLDRLWTIRVFDPACGSGNFLIIAYKELRKLEMEIFKRLQEISEQKSFPISGITLSQFYGIELDDFAHEIAILSLWLAEHQMNVAFKKTFGRTRPSLPLKEGGKIVCGNATRLKWEDVCPLSAIAETFVFGNPPYYGARNQSKIQKEDINLVLGHVPGVNGLDYICCWFHKAAKFIEVAPNAKFAFVSTNSLCQGQHVPLFWPHIISERIEIYFAYRSFKWSNSARDNAGVTCVIVGMRRRSTAYKTIYDGGLTYKAKNISPYLTDNRDIFIRKRRTPIAAIAPLVFGNQAIDGGHLILSDYEKNDIVAQYPHSERFFRRLYGAEDFLDGTTRWCIWVNERQLETAKDIPPLRERFRRVAKYRAAAGQVARSLTRIPYRFRYIHEAVHSLLVVPRTTSERRAYIPIGYLPPSSIVTDAVQVVYDADPYVMGVLSSRMHMVWTRAIAGGLETRIRYSNELCYNNFPVPRLTNAQRATLSHAAFNLIEAREAYPDLTLSQLYDPGNEMPDQLLNAHQELDILFESCFRQKPFGSDEERLQYLFDAYEKLVAATTAEAANA